VSHPTYIRKGIWFSKVGVIREGKTQTHHIGHEPLPVRCALRGSFACKRFQAMRKTRSLGYIPQQTRRDPRCHSCSRQTRSRAGLSSITRTRTCISKVDRAEGCGSY
jgi:hypothetical protein